MVVNVPDHPKLKVGNSLTLRGDDTRWGIKWVAAQPIEKDRLRTDWNNNI